MASRASGILMRLFLVDITFSPSPSFAARTPQKKGVGLLKVRLFFALPDRKAFSVRRTHMMRNHLTVMPKEKKVIFWRTEIYRLNACFSHSTKYRPPIRTIGRQRFTIRSNSLCSLFQPRVPWRSRLVGYTSQFIRDNCSLSAKHTVKSLKP